jgi:hypothetical protein
MIICKRLKASFFFCCAVNISCSTKKSSGCTELKTKPYNKENRFAAMKLKPSAAYQGGGCNSNKDNTFRVPLLPQLRTSKSSAARLTPISEHCRRAVTKQGTY